MDCKEITDKIRHDAIAYVINLYYKSKLDPKTAEDVLYCLNDICYCTSQQELDNIIKQLTKKE